VGADGSIGSGEKGLGSECGLVESGVASCFVEERCDGIQRVQIMDGDSSG